MTGEDDIARFDSRRYKDNVSYDPRAVTTKNDNNFHKHRAITVPDHASRIRNVVLVRRIFSSGNPRGSGIWDGEGMGRG